MFNSIKDNFILHNGVKIPCVGFGTWQIPNNQICVDAVKNALKAGYRHIDTASIYENEEKVGLAIRESDIPRDQIFVTSKLWNSDQGYESTLEAFDKTMKRLSLDYLDLYLIHWPIPEDHAHDYEELNAQTWKAFEELYNKGLIRAIGLSNFMVNHLQSLLKTAKIKPMVNQIEYHPGLLREDTVKFCKDNDIIIEAWSPLCRGRILDNKCIDKIAQKYNKSIAQICLRWVLEKGIIPLPKSATESRIFENADIFDFSISEEDTKYIDGLVDCGDSGLDPYKPLVVSK